MKAAVEVVAAIRAAFAGVPRGAVTIHEAEVIDRYGSDEERAAAVRAALAGPAVRPVEVIREQESG
jgi:hypothetical protein